jgi:competence protein ComEC
LAAMAPPDVLITGDGRNLAIVEADGRQLVMLRQGRSSFLRKTMLETSGIDGASLPVEAWRGAECNAGFCRLTLERGGRVWTILAARSKWLAKDTEMAAACAGVDIVVAQAQIFGECRPRLVKIDEPVLFRTGGMALYLRSGWFTKPHMATVAQAQGQHPWWRAPSGWPEE